MIQPETTPISETPVLLPKKNPLPKIVLLVILGLLVAGVLVYAGIAIGKKQNPPEVIPQVVEPSPTPDPTANWKTYRNDKYGFEFKYPEDYSLADIKEETVISAPLSKCSPKLTFNAEQYETLEEVKIIFKGRQGNLT